MSGEGAARGSAGRTAPLWVLVHSPLTGPVVWRPVAGVLQERGYDVRVPDLADTGAAALPYWERHARGVALALSIDGVNRHRPLVLAGHSGAGPLLPAIGRFARQPVAAYLFVDAGIPEDGKSRLDLMAGEDPGFAERLRAELDQGHHYPAWGSADLRHLIPDDMLRDQVVAGLRPQGRSFFTEPLPVQAGWPAAPCAFLQFSAAYAEPAARARELGWPVANLDAGHFHMLIDPLTVADAMTDLVRRAMR